MDPHPPGEGQCILVRWILVREGISESWSWEGPMCPRSSSGERPVDYHLSSEEGLVNRQEGLVSPRQEGDQGILVERGTGGSLTGEGTGDPG